MRRRKKKEEKEEEEEEERPIRFRVFCWLTVLWILLKVKEWKREEICATTSRGCKAVQRTPAFTELRVSEDVRLYTVYPNMQNYEF